MAKPSAFLQQIEARHRAELRLQRLFTMQQCEDMALIAANETFGFGPERSARLRQVIREEKRAEEENGAAEEKAEEDSATE